MVVKIFWHTFGYRVGLQLSEHIGTERCLDNSNVQITIENVLQNKYEGRGK